MPVITVYDNVVSGPEEEKIPAHLHFGQFMFDQFKNGGEKIAQVRIFPLITSPQIRQCM